MLDAWVYLDHGHVFATAQTGNVVLFAMGLAGGDAAEALRPLPSIAAFMVGLLASRTGAVFLKRAEMNSRTVRLSAECILLCVVAAVADDLPDRAITACIGFLSAVQITSLSHIGSWTFNTGMTTGNLRGFASALVEVAFDPRSKADRIHTLALASLCAAFPLGAVAGAFLTPRWHGAVLFVIAGLVLAAILVSAREPDPLAYPEAGR